MTNPKWIKSTRSGDLNCVETAFLDDGSVLMRDSKHPDGPILTFTRDEWDAFVAGARDGEFDV